MIFGSPVYRVGGFFTYLQPLTLSAYDASGALLGWVTAAFLGDSRCRATPAARRTSGSSSHRSHRSRLSS